MTFKLEIKLGQYGMQTDADVSWALRQVALELYDGTGRLGVPRGKGVIKLPDGKIVGRWKVAGR